MKKLFQILFVGLALLSFACKKSNQSPDQPPLSTQKKYPVIMTVSTFTETVSDMKSAVVPQTSDDPLGNFISFLYCRVYDAAGNMVFTTDQSQATTGFGTVAVEFAPGNYTAVFTGSQTALQINADASTKLTSAGFFAGQNSALYDTFYKKIDFTVVNQVSSYPIVQPVKLNRIVAGLNVIIEDAIPSGVSRIEVIMPDDLYSFTFSDESRSGAVSRSVNFPIATADLGIMNKSLKTYAFRINNPVTVILRAYSSNEVLIFEKSISNVTFFANKTTTLSGKLFIAKAGFSVSINSVWDAPPPVVKF